MNDVTQPLTLTLSQLNAENNLQDALSRLEFEVRGAPANARLRWALAEMLCILGQWERALKQLQTGAKLLEGKDPQWHSKAQMLRGLIRAEAQRTQVFAGQLLPVPVVDRPQWMEDLARAIALNTQGEHAQADAVRSSALDEVPTRSCVCIWRQESGEAVRGRPLAPGEEALREQTVEWISDTDTRIGPVCECIVAGGYRWLAYADIASMEVQRPRGLMDLVWLPATIRLRGTQAEDRPLLCYLPARYSGTENVAAEVGVGQRDALMLSRLTHWQEVGETGVFALGQKMLMTSHGDIPLLGLRQVYEQKAVDESGATA